jgi:hypothetical protein
MSVLSLVPYSRAPTSAPRDKVWAWTLDLIVLASRLALGGDAGRRHAIASA